MQVIQTPGGRIVRAWIDGVEFEDEARTQVENLARMPFLAGPPALMPDVHWGKGATIGSVFATEGAVIPAAVGVDIGCGMTARKTNLRVAQFEGRMPEVRAAIENVVPHGRTDNGGENDRGSWGVPQYMAVFEKELSMGYEWLKEVHPKLVHRRAHNQFGTMGGGNHFLELCTDENGDVWVVIHSGSRGQGATIGNYFIERAKRHMEQYFVSLPDANLAYLPDGTKDFEDYLTAVSWAQAYARANREMMMNATLGVLYRMFITDESEELCDDEWAVSCHHNYIAREKHFGKNCLVTRKGAIRAGKGELGIIPGSMGAKSYIVEGLGNHESLFTASHGAGRRMSRRKARETFTTEDLARATEGVECRKDAGVLDEIPLSYKDIDKVMEAQKDLVKVRHTLKQFLCIKGES